MLFQPTTTVSILRGSADDTYGDPADNSTVASSGIPASILERDRQSTDRATGTPRTVRYVTARLPAGIDVTEDDRIKDETTGSIYWIGSVSQLSSFVGTNELKLDLRKVN